MKQLPERDEEYLAAFERCELPWDLWNHRMHLRIAWMVLRRNGVARGLALLRTGIERYNRMNGRATSYHETITVAWVRLIGAAILRDGSPASFADFLEQHPELSDRDYLQRFYRTETLFSAAARATWIDPDLAPLPSIDSISQLGP